MEANFVVALAKTDQVDALWPRVCDGLEKAANNCGGDLSKHAMWTECRSGHCFLMVVSSGEEVIAASIWRFENWSGKIIFRCLSMYGEDFNKWVADHRKITEQIARAGGAHSIVAEGRKGLQALFPEAKVLRYLYEVELT